jgi:hypothetical protein
MGIFQNEFAELEDCSEVVVHLLLEFTDLFLRHLVL